jgi:acetyl-CoA synthetase (ADP-forming)
MSIMSSITEIFEKVKSENRKFLLETEAKNVCARYGIPITKFLVATTAEEAVRFAEKIGYPLVMKIVSPDVVHKSDVGGVMINIKTPKEIESAYTKILTSVKKHSPKARIVGVTVQEMAPESTEIIVGAIKDPQFGQTLMFGLGGIFVEILKDVTFRIAPVTEQEAKEMITEVKAYPLLQGYRGTPLADIDAIVKILLATSKLVMDHPEIKELDLNPVIVYQKGAKTVDARIILE